MSDFECLPVGTAARLKELEAEVERLRERIREDVKTERPILFSAPMVRAILSGTKTQTRRVVKGMALLWLRPDGFTPEFTALPENGLCPYGQPGDRLWVREAWRAWPDGVAYRADISDADLADAVHAPWRPSIHMHRAASRITLEITAVRVERLQDISEADAKAEGVTRPVPMLDDDPSTYVDAFGDLWASINGPGSWDSNPWVWVIEFRRVEV
jgi:hypothetical protein